MDENGDSFNSTKSTHTSFLNVCKSENEKDFDEFDNLSPILDAGDMFNILVLNIQCVYFCSF